MPADTPKKNRNWPKSLLPPPPDFSIDKNDVDEFNSILLSEMYSWTKFYRLNVFEQEIFWLLELSAIFADGARARFRYIHSNMTEELASFLEEKDITSISLLVTQYFRKIHPENKIEFIEKRKPAKKFIREALARLKALKSPDNVRIDFPGSRWLRFRYSKSDLDFSFQNREDINIGDYVYVLDFDKHYNKGGVSMIRGFKGKVLGKKERHVGQVDFYNLFMENDVVERVHEDSILTEKQIQHLKVNNPTPVSP